MTATEENLFLIWQELLGVPQIDLQDSFFNLGGTSLLAMQMIARVEEQFTRELAIEDFLEAPTIAHLSSLLNQNEAERQRPVLVPIQPEGDKPPFFCVHGGGGRIVHHHGLRHYFLPDQPLFGIQSPTMTPPQLTSLTIAGQAERYLRAVRLLQPAGPYYLGGLCFGGTIAFEMAQQLAAAGVQTALLVLFDTQFWGRAHAVTRAGFHLRQFARQHSSRWKKRLRPGESPRRNAAFPTPAKRIDNVNDFRQAMIRAAMQYHPRPYSGRIAYFLGQDHYDHGLDHDLRQGWNTVATGIETFIVPGFENQMFQEPHVARVAELLRGCLPQ